MDNGTIIKRVSRKRHRCKPPGWWQRIRLDLDYGSVWQCNCGRKYVWGFSWADSEWIEHE